MNQKSVVTIQNLSHDGRGIAHLNGKTIFVAGALVGEEVEIEYIKRKNRWDEAKIANILTPVPGRNIPSCDHFGVCGGCSLQHMANGTQIHYKQSVLVEQLLHIGNVKPKEILPPVTASDYGYRRKARLGVRYVHKKEKLLIGFREKNGRYLADIESCSVLDQSIGKKIPILRDFLLSLKNYLQIPQLEIAVGDEQTAIIIRHLAPFSIDDLAIIKDFGRQHQYQIYLQPGSPQTASLLWPLEGRPRLNYKLVDQDIEMLFHPTDFTQVNHEINQKLVNLAIELLDPKKTEVILDLFCGIGNFTLPLARYCAKVVGIEGAQDMVQRGYENATHNNIDNVEFQCRNLADYTSQADWLFKQFDAILLDPPRVGAWEIVQSIPATTAKKLIYVSCNPATLARDAGYLCQNGFELSRVGVLDMFPHTSHVESIALFHRV